MKRSEDSGGGRAAFGAGIPHAPTPRPKPSEPPGAGPRAAAAPRRADARAAVLRDLLLEGPLTAGVPPLEALARVAADALEALADHPGAPPVPTVDRLVSTAEVAVAADPAFATAALVAIRPHWCEPMAAWVGRAVAALERGARVALVVSKPLEPFATSLAERLSDALEPAACTGLADPQYDLVRRIAGIAGIELDLLVPDAFATGLVKALRSARAKAELDDSPASEALVERRRGAFGAGIVEAGRAALRVRPAAGRAVVYDADAAAALGAEIVIDGSIPPSDAAREVARLAFGPEAIGGYASEAVARVHVGARRLSEFTEELLVALADDALGPPAWTRAGEGGEGGEGARRGHGRGGGSHAITARLDPAALAARRIGLDEGATLIHDDLSPGAHALVFTNVEPRMRLGSTLRGPAVLALLRVRS